MKHWSDWEDKSMAPLLCDVVLRTSHRSNVSMSMGFTKWRFAKGRCYLYLIYCLGSQLDWLLNLRWSCIFALKYHFNLCLSLHGDAKYKYEALVSFWGWHYRLECVRHFFLPHFHVRLKCGSFFSQWTHCSARASNMVVGRFFTTSTRDPSANLPEEIRATP